MRIWVTVRGDEELYLRVNPSDPGAWDLAVPTPGERELLESLTEAEGEDIDRQINEALCDPNRDDD